MPDPMFIAGLGVPYRISGEAWTGNHDGFESLKGYQSQDRLEDRGEKVVHGLFIFSSLPPTKGRSGLTLSCPDVPPLRFRGTLTSIRCLMVVMCSDTKHIAATPMNSSVSSAQNQQVETYPLRK